MIISGSRDEIGKALRDQLAASMRPQDFQQHIGKPRIYFRLNREFSQTTALIAFDFLVEFHQLSGTYLEPLSVTEGCVTIEGLPHRVTDRNGVDFQQLFLQNSDYHRFSRGFGLQHIYFHAFPRVLDGRNQGVAYYFDNNGRPITHAGDQPGR